MSKKRLYIRKIQDAKKIVDLYLEDNNIKTLNKYEKKRLKEFKNTFANLNEGDKDFKKQINSFEKFLGINKQGISANRKKDGAYKKDKEGFYYLSIDNIKNEMSTIEYQDKDIVDVLLDFDDFKRNVEDFNVINYLSSFCGNFYDDWVDRFRKSVGMGGMNIDSVKYWTRIIINDYEEILNRFGRRLVEETLIELRKNDYKPIKNNNIEKTLLSFLRKN